MTLRAAPQCGPGTTAPDSRTLPVSALSKDDDALAQLPGEKSTGSDESPAETESARDAEFKEGGYGWLV